MTVTTFGSNIREHWASRPGLRAWAGETLSWLAILLLGFAVTGLLFVAIAPRLLGWNLVVVAGGSMEPTIEFGSVAVVEDVKPAELRVGDIVMFREANGRVVTHRIVAVSDDGNLLTTRGDANNTDDESKVPVQAVQARYRYSVPDVGRFVRWMGTRGGYLSLVLIPGMIVIALELVSVVKAVRGNRPESS